MDVDGGAKMGMSGGWIRVRTGNFGMGENGSSEIELVVLFSLLYGQV